MMPLVDSAFVGRLGVSEFAAASLSNALYNMIWLFMVGCCTATTTFISQSHGKDDHRAVKYWFRHSMLAMTLLCVPAMVLLSCGGLIVEYIFYQSKEISNLSRTFCLILVPGLWFNTAFTVVQNTMQAQNIMMPSVYCSLLANVLNFIANYFLIFESGLGFIGAPIATTFSRLILLVSLYCFRVLGISQNIAEVQDEQTLNITEDTNDGKLTSGFDLSGIKRFLGIALPGGIMQSMEGWFFNITVVLAGFLGEIVLSAHQIMLNVIAFTYLSVPFSVSITASIRVGNLLGANFPFHASSATAVCIILATGFMVFSGTAVILARSQVGLIFTSDKDVLKICEKIFPIGAVFQVVDGIQTSIAGSLRGMGKQNTIAKLNLFAYWVIGTPAGALLAFVAGFGVYGLWWGITIGLTTVAIIFAWKISKINWVDEAEKAQRISKIEQIPAETDFQEKNGEHKALDVEDNQSTAPFGPEKL